VNRKVTWWADSGASVQKSHCALLSRSAVAGLRELHGVADEEDGRVVADEVVVALAGVELQREPARVADRVGRALLTGDGGEAQQRLGAGTGLEQRRLGELGDVVGDLEEAERAAALRVHVALRDALTVEMSHLGDEVMVMEQDRAVAADGERKGVARCRCARLGGGQRCFGRCGHS
jgi:hypothetical protein